MVVGYKGKFIGAKRLNVRLFSEFLRTKELPISNTSRNAPSVEKKAILFSVPRVPRRSTWTVTSRHCVTCRGICRRKDCSDDEDGNCDGHDDPYEEDGYK